MAGLRLSVVNRTRTDLFVISSLGSGLYSTSYRPLNDELQALYINGIRQSDTDQIQINNSLFQMNIADLAIGDEIQIEYRY